MLVWIITFHFVVEHVEGVRATIHNHSSLLISVFEPSHPWNMEGNLCG